MSRYAHAGGWQRPPGAPKYNTFANGLTSPQLRGRMRARRLRDICERYLDDMERQPDPRDVPDCGTVLMMLRMAKEEERRRRRPSLAMRARALAGRYLDQLEADPEPDPEGLAWVLRMLETAREEEARTRKRPIAAP